MTRYPLGPPAGILGRCSPGPQNRPNNSVPKLGKGFREVSDLIALYLPLVPPGRLEANHTLEGAGSSITSVDFDPSVSGLCPSSMGCFLPPQSPPQAAGGSRT